MKKIIAAGLMATFLVACSSTPVTPTQNFLLTAQQGLERSHTGMDNPC